MTKLCGHWRDCDACQEVDSWIRVSERIRAPLVKQLYIFFSVYNINIEKTNKWIWRNMILLPIQFILEISSICIVQNKKNNIIRRLNYDGAKMKIK